MIREALETIGVLEPVDDTPLSEPPKTGPAADWFNPGTEKQYFSKPSVPLHEIRLTRKYRHQEESELPDQFIVDSIIPEVQGRYKRIQVPNTWWQDTYDEHGNPISPVGKQGFFDKEGTNRNLFRNAPLYQNVRNGNYFYHMGNGQWFVGDQLASSVGFWRGQTKRYDLEAQDRKSLLLQLRESIESDRKKLMRYAKDLYSPFNLDKHDIKRVAERYDRERDELKGMEWHDREERDRPYMTDFNPFYIDLEKDNDVHGIHGIDPETGKRIVRQEKARRDADNIYNDNEVHMRSRDKSCADELHLEDVKTAEIENPEPGCHPTTTSDTTGKIDSAQREWYKRPEDYRVGDSGPDYQTTAKWKNQSQLSWQPNPFHYYEHSEKFLDLTKKIAKPHVTVTPGILNSHSAIRTDDLFEPEPDDLPMWRTWGDYKADLTELHDKQFEPTNEEIHERLEHLKSRREKTDLAQPSEAGKKFYEREIGPTWDDVHDKLYVMEETTKDPHGSYVKSNLGQSPASPTYAAERAERDAHYKKEEEDKRKSYMERAKRDREEKEVKPKADKSSDQSSDGTGKSSDGIQTGKSAEDGKKEAMEDAKKEEEDAKIEVAIAYEDQIERISRGMIDDKDPMEALYYARRDAAKTKKRNRALAHIYREVSVEKLAYSDGLPMKKTIKIADALGLGDESLDVFEGDDNEAGDGKKEGGTKKQSTASVKLDDRYGTVFEPWDIDEKHRMKDKEGGGKQSQKGDDKKSDSEKTKELHRKFQHDLPPQKMDFGWGRMLSNRRGHDNAFVGEEDPDAFYMTEYYEKGVYDDDDFANDVLRSSEKGMKSKIRKPPREDVAKLLGINADSNGSAILDDPANESIGSGLFGQKERVTKSDKQMRHEAELEMQRKDEGIQEKVSQRTARAGKHREEAKLQRTLSTFRQQEEKREQNEERRRQKERDVQGAKGKGRTKVAVKATRPKAAGGSSVSPDRRASFSPKDKGKGKGKGKNPPSKSSSPTISVAAKTPRVNRELPVVNKAAIPKLSATILGPAKSPSPSPKVEVDRNPNFKELSVIQSKKPASKWAKSKTGKAVNPKLRGGSRGRSAGSKSAGSDASSEGVYATSPGSDQRSDYQTKGGYHSEKRHYAEDADADDSDSGYSIGSFETEVVRQEERARVERQREKEEQERKPQAFMAERAAAEKQKKIAKQWEKPSFDINDLTPYNNYSEHSESNEIITEGWHEEAYINDKALQDNIGEDRSSTKALSSAQKKLAQQFNKGVPRVERTRSSISRPFANREGTEFQHQYMPDVPGKVSADGRDWDTDAKIEQMDIKLDDIDPKTQKRVKRKVHRKKDPNGRIPQLRLHGRDYDAKIASMESPKLRGGSPKRNTADDDYEYEDEQPSGMFGAFASWLTGEDPNDSPTKNNPAYTKLTKQEKMMLQQRTGPDAKTGRFRLLIPSDEMLVGGKEMDGKVPVIQAVGDYDPNSVTKINLMRDDYVDDLGNFMSLDLKYVDQRTRHRVVYDANRGKLPEVYEVLFQIQRRGQLSNQYVVAQLALDFLYGVCHLKPNHPRLTESQCQLFSTMCIDLVRFFPVQPEIAHYGIGALLVIFHQTKYRQQLGKPIFTEISNAVRNHKNILFIQALSLIMSPVAIQSSNLALDPPGSRFGGGGVYHKDKSGLLEEENIWDSDLEDEERFMRDNASITGGAQQSAGGFYSYISKGAGMGQGRLQDDEGFGTSGWFRVGGTGALQAFPLNQANHQHVIDFCLEELDKAEENTKQGTHNYVRLMEQCITIFYIGQAYDYRLEDQMNHMLRSLDTCVSQTCLLLKALIGMQSMFDYLFRNRRSVNIRILTNELEDFYASRSTVGAVYDTNPNAKDVRQIVVKRNVVALLLNIMDLYPNWRKVQGACMFALNRVLQCCDLYRTQVITHALPSVLLTHTTHIKSYAVQFHFLCILETVGRYHKLSEHCLAACFRIIHAQIFVLSGTENTRRSEKLIVKSLRVALSLLESGLRIHEQFLLTNDTVFAQFIICGEVLVTYIFERFLHSSIAKKLSEHDGDPTKGARYQDHLVFLRENAINKEGERVDRKTFDTDRVAQETLSLMLVGSEYDILGLGLRLFLEVLFHLCLAYEAIFYQMHGVLSVPLKWLHLVSSKAEIYADALTCFPEHIILAIRLISFTLYFHNRKNDEFLLSFLGMKGQSVVGKALTKLNVNDLEIITAAKKIDEQGGVFARATAEGLELDPEEAYNAGLVRMGRKALIFAEGAQLLTNVLLYARRQYEMDTNMVRNFTKLAGGFRRSVGASCIAARLFATACFISYYESKVGGSSGAGGVSAKKGKKGRGKDGKKGNQISGTNLRGIADSEANNEDFIFDKEDFAVYQIQYHATIHLRIFLEAILLQEKEDEEFRLKEEPIYPESKKLDEAKKNNAAGAKKEGQDFGERAAEQKKKDEIIYDQDLTLNTAVKGILNLRAEQLCIPRIGPIVDDRVRTDGTPRLGKVRLLTEKQGEDIALVEATSSLTFILEKRRRYERNFRAEPGYFIRTLDQRLMNLKAGNLYPGATANEMLRMAQMINETGINATAWPELFRGEASLHGGAKPGGHNSPGGHRHHDHSPSIRGYLGGAVAEGGFLGGLFGSATESQKQQIEIDVMVNKGGATHSTVGSTTSVDTNLARSPLALIPPPPIVQGYESVKPVELMMRVESANQDRMAKTQGQISRLEEKVDALVSLFVDQKNREAQASPERYKDLMNQGNARNKILMVEPGKVVRDANVQATVAVPKSFTGGKGLDERKVEKGAGVGKASGVGGRKPGGGAGGKGGSIGKKGKRKGSP